MLSLYVLFGKIDGKSNLVSFCCRASTNSRQSGTPDGRNQRPLVEFRSTKNREYGESSKRGEFIKESRRETRPVEIYRRRNARYFEHKGLQGYREITKDL